MPKISLLVCLSLVLFITFDSVIVFACKSKSFFGINIDPKNPYGEAPIASLNEIGVGSVRIEFKDSSQGDQTPNDGFSFFDSKISNYQSNNIEILLIIDYSSLAGTPWGSSDANEWIAFSEKYSDRASLIATHYKGKIFAYQIWNEPDLVGDESYKPYIPAQSYGKILKKAYETIKAADPSAKVITGGFASGNMNYITQMKNAVGGIIYADAVATHPYGQRAPDNMPQPQWGFGNLSEFIPLVQAVSDGKPLWITELGTVDQDYQSEYVKAVYRMTFNQFSSTIDRLFWFCWSDSMVPPFGLVDNSQQPKNTYHSYKSIFQELSPSFSSDPTDCESQSTEDTENSSNDSNGNNSTENDSDNSANHQSLDNLEPQQDQTQEDNSEDISPHQNSSESFPSDNNDFNTAGDFVPTLKTNHTKTKIDNGHSERSEGCQCQRKSHVFLTTVLFFFMILFSMKRLSQETAKNTF